MKLWSTATTLLPTWLVAIYTWNYGRWAAKQRLVWGAFGLYLLAVACVVVPVFVFWYTA